MTERPRPSRVLLDAVLKGQRWRPLAAAVPTPARRYLKRRIAAWVDRSASGALIEDWSHPLTPAGALDPLRGGSDEAAAAVTSNSHATEARATAPTVRGAEVCRCLIATSALDVGGMDEMVAFLARRLPAHGVQVAVLHTASVTTSQGRLARMLSAAGVEVMILPEAPGRRWMHNWQPDVVSAHGASDWVLAEARQMSVPYVDVLHGMHSLFDADWALEADRSRGLAAIVAVSELVRQQYLARVPSFPAERIVTIPNGVDADRRARVDRAEARAALGLRSEFLFVSLARHCLQKNTFALVDAFDDVATQHPDAHLLIAGRPEDPIYCRQVVKRRDDLAARGRIHLRDHADNPGLVMAAADAFVLDSFFEGWALASMEALHAGLPVVSSEVGGAREQIGDSGERGYVVANPLGDPLKMDWRQMRAACYERQVNRPELVGAINEIAEDRSRWAAKREDLAAESALRFHPDHCAREHAGLLRSLAHADKPQIPSSVGSGAEAPTVQLRLVPQR